jgi:TolA-binding protein
MRRVTLLIAMACLAVSPAWCQQKGGKDSGSTTDQVRQNAGKEKSEAEQQKDDFVKKAREQLDQLDKQIAELKAKARTANAETQKQINKSIAELEPKRKAAEKRLDQLKSSSDKAWKDMKDGVLAAINDLSTACTRAASRFK